MQGSPKKATTKKVAIKKIAAKKTAAKRSAQKKAATKKVAAKKTATKKVAAKKTAARKPAAKKAAAKKTAIKKVAAKKPATKKTAAKKPAATKRVGRRRRPLPMIGWREWVVLDEWSPTPIKVKVDTGAVTSAIHAFDLELIEVDGQTVARFGIAPEKGSRAEIVPVEHPVVGFKQVRSSNGQTELRPVVKTIARIGSESWEIDITLASRDSMGFRMLLGRKAVRNRFWVDPGRSFLQPHDDVERGDSR